MYEKVLDKLVIRLCFIASDSTTDLSTTIMVYSSRNSAKDRIEKDRDENFRPE